MPVLRIALLCLLSLRATAAADVKITTFNTMLVCVGPGCLLAQEPDLESRAKGIGRWLKESGSDIVFLQEAFQKRHFELIREAAGLPHSWFVQDGTGLAILSRFPLAKLSWTPFRWQAAYFKDCKRLVARLQLGLGIAEATLPDGERWRLAVTHFLPRYTEVAGFREPRDAHSEQREILALEVAQRLSDEQMSGGRLPLILGGDFNLNQASVEYAFLKEVLGLDDALRTGFRGSEEEWRTLCTYCGTNPHVVRQKNEDEKALDHIFLSPRQFAVASAVVPTSTDELSDHRPIVVTARRTAGEAPFVPHFPTDRVKTLLQYVSDVAVHPLCYLAPTAGWAQKKATRLFLEQLPSRTRHKGWH